MKTTFKKDLNTATILGITFVSTSLAGLLNEIKGKINKQKLWLVTPNPEFLVYSVFQPWFKIILLQADYALPDGAGLIWASHFLGRPLANRITGTDLMASLCYQASQQGQTVYLLGGRGKVADQALARLEKSYPGLQGWADSGPDLAQASQKEIRAVLKRLNQKKPDFLFVAFGMGKQEKFIADHFDQLQVKLAMGVGGAFDYFSCYLPRAPLFWRRLGLEWLFRLVRQPWRLPRVFQAVVIFPCLILLERLGLIKS